MDNFTDSDLENRYGYADTEQTIRKGRDYPGRSHHRTQAAPKGHTLFVRNLDFGVTVNKLTKLFDRFGDITKVHIVTTDAGRSKGFGFVRFAEVVDAGKALAKLDGHELAGRTIHVSYALPPGDGAASAK